MQTSARNITKKCALHSVYPFETKNGGDTSSSRHIEHGAGSVLGVREQDARKYNEEMRRIYVVFKQ